MRAATSLPTIHVIPSDPAAGSLRLALRDAGRDETVVPWPDDLSCGPIDPDTPATREAWWATFGERRAVAEAIGAFWEAVATRRARLVVWFGRHCAAECCFFHALADRMGDRAFEIVDVTGRTFERARSDGTTRTSKPAQAVSLLASEDLLSLLDAPRPATATEIGAARQTWRRLRQEDAPFRIVTEGGLVSAPSDVFDPLLQAAAKPEWERMVAVIGQTMGENMEPYIQTGDAMLHARIVALIEAGALAAEGDPRDMRACGIRRPS